MTRLPADGCLAPTAPFAEMVQDFVRKWNLARPQPGGQYGATGASPIRALAWLAGETELPEATVQNVFEARFQHVELRVADRIATALDKPFIFSDPRVEGNIIPNPFASRAARAECCGGSEQLAATG